VSVDLKSPAGEELIRDTDPDVDGATPLLFLHRQPVAGLLPLTTTFGIRNRHHHRG